MGKTNISAPLSAGFTAIGILGFFISIWFIMDYSVPWGFTLALFFFLMFLASLVSMTRAEPIDEHINELAVHEKKKELKYMPKKAESVTLKKWHEYVIIGYFALWVYFAVTSFRAESAVSELFFISFITLTVVMMLWQTVDVVTNETITTLKMIVFAALIVFLGAIGIMIYYLYKKVMIEHKKAVRETR